MQAGVRIAAVFLFSSAQAFGVEVMYATSTPTLVTDSAPAVLYRVDPLTATSKTIGPIKGPGGESIYVAGLADDPATGRLYGVTSPRSPTNPNSLVIIDLASGDAAIVGKVGAAASDIAFDHKGTLFAWLRESNQMATVDLSTGLATPLGKPGPPGERGAVTIDPQDRIYVIGTGATGSIDGFDLSTGALSKGPGLKGMPFAAGINSMTFSSSGTIYAVNTNHASPATALLVRIDPSTGSVVRVGALPRDTDAIVLIEAPRGLSDFLTRGNVSILAAVVCLGLAIGAIVVLRRSSERQPR
ncbi:hypothetical protein [Usitatibacter palustris]|uniref:YncE family protein n=1 Tax=Usitatibacter palustris TaxID=2732487 RepID=A0A6M4H8S8_9PROT|nr:hypothetical protein [Usitatibacter palustris]QJR15123.1 hypothetical protein DSM104440_01940 [Usitatibacter palustris]